LFFGFLVFWFFGFFLIFLIFESKLKTFLFLS